MLVAYVRQRLIDPIRGAGRYLGVGVLASFLLAVGLVLVALGCLRGLQSIPALQRGGLDVLPYLATTVVVVGVVGFVVARIPRDSLHRDQR